MNIHVEYRSQLRLCVGASEERVALDAGADVGGLLRAIAERHGAAVAALLFSDGGLPSATLLCFVASEQVNGNSTLSDGDVVTLITPISGG